jgi:hypothetical protein
MLGNMARWQGFIKNAGGGMAKSCWLELLEVVVRHCRASWLGTLVLWALPASDNTVAGAASLADVFADIFPAFRRERI